MKEQRSPEGNPYADIMFLEHPEPRSHRRMPMENRAAQFAPFAALTGYEASLEETARLTETAVDLSEEQRAELDRKLMLIRTCLRQSSGDELTGHDAGVAVKIRYFVPDERKEGGAYRTLAGMVRKIDDYGKQILMMGGEIIPVEAVVDIELPGC